jgi:competence protein ComEA
MSSPDNQGLLSPPPEANAPPLPSNAPSVPASKAPPVVESSDVKDPDEAFGLTSGDRRFLLLAGSVILILTAVHWARLSGWGAREIEILRLPERRYEFQIDINRGTWVEWMQIDGIGEITARRIVANREDHGPFHSIEDLTRVKGIGPKTLEKMRPWLTCPDCN